MARHHAGAGKGTPSATPKSLVEQLRDAEEAHAAGHFDPGCHLDAIGRRIEAMERMVFPAPITDSAC